MNLEEKVLKYIIEHPNGVRISDMEEPLGERRMKLGFATSNLCDKGKVQQIDQMYFLIKTKLIRP